MITLPDTETDVSSTGQVDYYRFYSYFKLFSECSNPRTINSKTLFKPVHLKLTDLILENKKIQAINVNWCWLHFVYMNNICKQENIAYINV